MNALYGRRGMQRGTALLLALLLGSALSLTTATAARADGISWLSGSITAGVGDAWEAWIDHPAPNQCNVTPDCPNVMTIDFTGTSSGSFQVTADSFGQWWFAFDTVPGGPLGIGEYSFVANYAYPDGTTAVTSVLPVVITAASTGSDARPAAPPADTEAPSLEARLSLDVTVRADRLDQTRARIRAGATTTLMDAQVPFTGVWSVRAEDSAGEVVLDEQIPSGDLLDYWWEDVPPGTDFTITVSLRPDPARLNYVAPEPAVVEFTSPPASDSAPAAESHDDGLSPWLVITLVAVIVLVLASVVALIVVRRRGKREPEAESAVEATPTERGELVERR